MRGWHERLVFGDYHASVAIEFDSNDSRFFKERTLRVVAEVTCPPAILFVFEEACSASTRHGLMPVAVRTMDRIRHGKACRVTAFVAVCCSKVILSICLEERRTFVSEILHATGDTLLGVVSGSMVGIGQNDRVKVPVKATHVVLQSRDLNCGGPR